MIGRFLTTLEMHIFANFRVELYSSSGKRENEQREREMGNEGMDGEERSFEEKADRSCDQSGGARVGPSMNALRLVTMW